jgi:hypothetical protein
MTKNVEKSKDSLQIPKVIIYTSKFLEAISSKLVTVHTNKLLTSQLKMKLLNIKYIKV